jgi:hypothetical protein
LEAFEGWQDERIVLDMGDGCFVVYGSNPDEAPKMVYLPEQ